MSTTRWLYLVILFPTIIHADGLALGERHNKPRRSHWAFRPVQRPAVPKVENKTNDRNWGNNAIDRFVLAKLSEAGMSPSSRADRSTLIRRAYFDLTGLPPTYDEIQALLDDRSPDAFGRLVDVLLSRPEYGERWGRHWLDLARYADTKGYVDAGEPLNPFAYTYRDYVIGAFNKDLPYDQFVLQQLAADRLITGDDRRPLAALGFLTVGRRFNFFPHEIIDDRIDVVARGLMGLTMTCARCHDHKYDPISTDDYYALYGVFASSAEPLPHKLPIIATSHKPVADQETLEQKVEEAAEILRKRRQELHENILNEMRAWAGDYLVYLVESMPEHRTQSQLPRQTERGRLRIVSAYGRGGVVRWQRYLRDCGTDHPVFGFWNRVIQFDRETFGQRAQELVTDLVIGGQMNPLLGKALSENPPQSMVDVARSYGALLEETDRICREVQEGDKPNALIEDPAHGQLREVLYSEGSPGTVTLDESEDLYHQLEHEGVRKLYADVERALIALGSVPARAMVMVDRPQAIEPRVFVRGNPDRPGKRVPRRVPHLLSHLHHEPFQHGSGRLELAQCIVNPDNPLTARVIVNRVWAWHFGQGLVATPSDFGLRGSPPTHPDLLDYLAAWFMENGWSFKKLHRLIVSSDTWQQSSDDRPECRQVAPENKFLWHMNRRRRDFESMRDSMLLVTGRLYRRGAGPSTKKRPDDVSNVHRTVYGQVDRKVLPGLLRVFDFPSPDISSPMRPHTTVPQQALFLMNSPFVIAQAESLAHRMKALLPSHEIAGRIQFLHHQVYGRDAMPEEVLLAERFITRPSVDSSGADGSDGLMPRWVEYVQVLLQSNEFQFVD